MARPQYREGKMACCTMAIAESARVVHLRNKIGQLIVSVRRLELRKVPEGGDHCAAVNVKIVGVTAKFDGQVKCATAMQVCVKALHVHQNGVESRNNGVLLGRARS
jgi:hypothetical protein